MKRKRLFLLTGMAVVVMLESCRLFADSPVTFDVLTTIDYPNAVHTGAGGINDRGDVAGWALNDQVERGYVRFANGEFSALFAEPNAVNGETWPFGINNARTVCGWYPSTSGDRGFVLSGSIFTDVIIDAAYTHVARINDAGNLCGSVNYETQSFVRIDGTVTVFSVPGAVYTEAFGINNLNQVVGVYSTTEGSFGFRRDVDGTLTYPIKAPTGQPTYLIGINDNGQMVGNTTDQRGRNHGIFFASPHLSAVFDYPGAGDTYFDGINNRGQICGYYFDSTNHGLIVRVRPAMGE